MSDEKDMSTAEFEAAITEMWGKYTCRPAVMWYNTSFATIRISAEGFRVVESERDPGRELTPEELDMFKAEAPALFK